MRWCFDSWYANRSLAEAAGDLYEESGVTDDYTIVRVGYDYAVLYLSDSPFAAWHADPTEPG